MRHFIIFFFLMLAVSVGAQNNQDEHISSFNMTSFTYKHNKKWSAYIELQSRSIEDYMHIDYYEVKGGVGYNFTKNNQFLVGLGRYGTYRNHQFYQNEFRVWLQYIFNHSLSRVKFDHRVRLEKRFFEYPLTGDYNDTERYRYRLTATVPINKKKVGPKTFFVNVFDEFFVGPKMPTLKRNRVFGGVGYSFNNNVAANLGYLWQREFSEKGNRNFHFLYFALNFTLDRTNQYRHTIIPVAD